MKVTVLGAGNMGTTIAQVIASKGYDVQIWNYEGDPDPLEQIQKYHENKKYLPGIALLHRIKPQPDLEHALKGSRIVFFVVPSSFMSAIVARAQHFITPKTILVDVSKGFGEEYLQNKNFRTPVDRILKRMVAISGPAIAIDLARGGFTAMNIAATNTSSIRVVRNVLETDFLKLVVCVDVRGVKLCGALKNVYAILLGVCDGMKFPMNTKAFFLTKALEEMGCLVGRLGGNKNTVYSLAGLGDLVGTGLCATSRNRRFGEFLVCAASKAEAESQVGQVVEGVKASKILCALAKKYRIDMPLAQLVYDIVWRSKHPETSLHTFLKLYHDRKKKR